ncbi:DUF1543 domain-containing protein [Dickeya undicola]|uniref:DUF1543 domain-containing protein n=1 Tax=Dickeya undicola TaxID=1577887 RepID=UPI003F279912
MPTLFMYYVGGRAQGANIELHDVQFAAVERPEDGFPLLKANWFGDKSQVHVDSYTPCQWADGYDITLSSQPFHGREKLWFVNMGGYLPYNPAEVHQFGLFVATNAEQAKQRAKAVLLTDVLQQHKDDLRDVDDCLPLTLLDRWYIHLTANPAGQVSPPLWQGYHPL